MHELATTGFEAVEAVAVRIATIAFSIAALFGVFAWIMAVRNDRRRAMNGEAGKGDTPRLRLVSQKEYDRRWRIAFGATGSTPKCPPGECTCRPCGTESGTRECSVCGQTYSDGTPEGHRTEGHA